MTHPPFSATQLEAAKRLCAATFTRGPRYNRYLFAGGPVRTFKVRTCLPATDKLYTRALRGDPCSYCGAKDKRGRNQLGHIFPVVHVPRRKTKQDLLNVTAMCTSCNRGCRQPPLYFMLDQLDVDASPRVSARELLVAVVDLTQRRGSRVAIERLARRALEALDREAGD